MRMGSLQLCIVGMRLRVVPEQLFVAAPDFITIPVDHPRQAVEQDSFSDHRTESVIKINLASDSPQRGAEPDQNDSGLANGFELVRKAINEQLVVPDRPQ